MVHDRAREPLLWDCNHRRKASHFCHIHFSWQDRSKLLGKMEEMLDFIISEKLVLLFHNFVYVTQQAWTRDKRKLKNLQSLQILLNTKQINTNHICGNTKQLQLIYWIANIICLVTCCITRFYILKVFKWTSFLIDHTCPLTNYWSDLKGNCIFTRTDQQEIIILLYYQIRNTSHRSYY